MNAAKREGDSEVGAGALPLAVCYSGGATGADALFGQCAEKVGHKVIHYSFEGHGSKEKNTVKLNMFELMEADPYLQDANKYIRRTFPSKKAEVNSLLRRNYYQVRETKRVYAVCPLDDRGIPLGGTAWAVAMAVVLKVRDIHVFDTFKGLWVRFVEVDPTTKQFIWKAIEWTQVPFPSRQYTGIGSRTISASAEKAVKQLYGLVY